MTRKEDLARGALFKALTLRQDHSIEINQVFDIFDFTASCGIEVRFVEIPSLEAMYIREDQSRIIVSSLRPIQRQAFNCAHELGHHVFGHTSMIDQYIDAENNDRSFQPNEYVADRFASFLLMPKTLVSYAFNLRGWTTKECTAQQVYTIANWLGVGYSTLIYQMSKSINLMSATKARKLLLHTPKEIRKQLLGRSVCENVIVVDHNWKDRAIDVCVGDYLLLMEEVDVEGKSVVHEDILDDKMVYKAVSPGIGRVLHKPSGWFSYVRVSRRGYVGRSLFRHLEDPENG